MLVFAGLQLNDPDPILGCGIFNGRDVIICWEKQWNRHLFILGSLYFLLAIWLFPSEYYGIGTMDVDKPEVEQARESLGIFIASGICFWGIC